MEGFRCFLDTESLRIPQSPLPECVSGSSSQNPIGESHFDQTLEAAFSRLKVSPFCRQPQLSRFDAIAVMGFDKIPNKRSWVGWGKFYPILQRRAESLNLNSGGNGVLSHLGLQDCWVQSDIDCSNGFVSNLNQHSDNSPHWLQASLNGWSVADLRGRVAFLATNQDGCRCLQRAMEAVPNKELIDLIFLEVLEHVATLMLDPHGNYVVQKLVEVCSEEQRTQMLLMLTKKNDLQLICISLDTRGTRSVQKLLKYISTKEQITLIMRALSPGVVALSKNSNGQHVIEHCLEHFSVQDNEYLLHVVANNCCEIAKDKSGCCVLQKCVEHSNGQNRERLVAAITVKAIVLAVDRYGNYVLQHLLGLRMPQITENLLRQLRGSYMSLSCNKYGSNVVEKCLLDSGEEKSSQIIFELLTNRNVSMLLLHPFGNYVIQTALSVSKGLYHNALLNLVQLNSHVMRGNYYGQKGCKDSFIGAAG
ncbi:pumilio homolog 12 [Prunus yedoensis var. nudiflora]|uniref:Pumilio homolog 12 n=1 Tax=Prunus yedoensis var. nudiflora TaxID=2094558 RepID=A0A314YLD4_PRUYE|nr:pumilio homolog 12 [Prunus yedoensis var. nudiflora]